MITKEQEVLLKDLRKSHASLAEAEKIIRAMEGLTASEKKLALRLHIPYTDTEQEKKTSVPEPPPVAEPNEILTLGTDLVSRRRSQSPKYRKYSVFWMGVVGGAVSLIVLLVVFAKSNRTENTSDKRAESKTLAETVKETVFVYSLQGAWKGGPGEQIKIEFRSDGSIVEQGVKVELLTWHGDYLSLNTKKIRDTRTESMTKAKKRLLDNAEQQKKQLLDNAERQKKQLVDRIAQAKTIAESTSYDPDVRQTNQSHAEQFENQLKQNEEQLANQLKQNEALLASQLKQNEEQLERMKNSNWTEWNLYLGMGVDKNDISETSDKVEVRIHWVDADHIDLGSTPFARVKEKN